MSSVHIKQFNTWSTGKGATKRYFWNAVGMNGNPVAASAAGDGYSRKEDRDNAVYAMQESSDDTPIVEGKPETEKQLIARVKKIR